MKHDGYAEMGPVIIHQTHTLSPVSVGDFGSVRAAFLPNASPASSSHVALRSSPEELVGRRDGVVGPAQPAVHRRWPPKNQGLRAPDAGCRVRGRRARLIGKLTKARPQHRADREKCISRLEYIRRREFRPQFSPCGLRVPGEVGGILLWRRMNCSFINSPP